MGNDLNHLFTEIAPDSFRCECGAEADGRSERDRWTKHVCNIRTNNAAVAAARRTDPLGAFDLIKSIETQEGHLAADKARLMALQDDCDHSWDKIEHTPTIRQAYTEPGYVAGVHGPVPARHIPEKKTDRWTRTCTRCGKSETTTQAEEKVIRSPKFSA